jgi:co-chaperonin GroES (HSP10)
MMSKLNEVQVSETEARELEPRAFQGDGILGTSEVELSPTSSSKKNLYTIISGAESSSHDLAMEALGDLLIVVEDIFKTGYECKTCNKNGLINFGSLQELDIETHKTTITCPDCVDGRSYVNPEIKCKTCQGTTKITCPACNGRGGTLITPADAQRRPTSGTIMSVGPDTKHLVPGDRVLYSLFAGSAIQFKQKAVVRIMHEHEVMVRLHGIGKLGDLVK